jgi:hypothetical protein
VIRPFEPLRGVWRARAPDTPAAARWRAASTCRATRRATISACISTGGRSVRADDAEVCAWCVRKPMPFDDTAQIPPSKAPRRLPFRPSGLGGSPKRGPLGKARVRDAFLGCECGLSGNGSRQKGALRTARPQETQSPRLSEPALSDGPNRSQPVVSSTGPDRPTPEPATTQDIGFQNAGRYTRGGIAMTG